MKIVSKPSTGTILILVFFVLFAAATFLRPITEFPWPAVVLLVFALLITLRLSVVTVDAEQITIRYLVTGGRKTIRHNELQSVTISLMPPTMASMVGLSKQGKLMRIQSASGVKIIFGSSVTSRFDEVALFFRLNFPTLVADHT